MRRVVFILLFAVLGICCANAQRKTDALDRGLVAVAKASGVFVSWRVQADEYYDVKYNLYRGSTIIAENLGVSNYTDADGTASSTYKVAAVINGVEQTACAPVAVWSTTDGNSNAYLKVQMQDVVDRNGDVVYCSCGSHTPSSDVAQNYILNDCSVADLDGDGEMEIIVKRINESDASSTDSYAFNSEIYSTTNTRAYVLLEAYKLDGTRLWWIDCGPNMVSMGSVEIDIIAYDWDQDGKAEVILRGADNMIVHKSDGTSYYIGDSSVNTRGDLNSHTNSQYAWTHTGAEYLIYLDGATGAKYQVIDYPLPRFESDESGMTEQKVWSPSNTSGGYGHRSNKFFFGAPVLDGRKASIFLARGIYTQIKMCALDVDASTHALTTRWTWRCKDTSSDWFGQGYHNYSIADVDGDGCDEIIYGSMVIDNNGKGLSTTGLGHGDAQHVSDFDPYRKGLEVFACNEDSPAMNYRNGTTSELYYRVTSSSDDGRAMMGNFTDEYPGSVGRSVGTGMISSCADKEITELGGNDFIHWSDLNWRIYWDGDLCSEYLDSPGEEGYFMVYKPESGNGLIRADITKLNNSSKNNPAFAGDIIGDWREEVIARNSDNNSLCVYTTTFPTEYRLPSLWYDAEYRQAMVWQMCAYNQPPHVGYFVGALEGITQAPVPNTMTGRTEIATSGDCIPAAADGSPIIAYGLANIGIPTAGASPSQLIVDVPSTVSGSGSNSGISYSYSTSNLGYGNYKGDLTGSMRLVKQGDGLMKITAKTFAFTGNTDIFAGSVYFRGTLTSSPVWMNRFTTLYTAGTYNRAVTMEYGSTLYINYTNSQTDGSAPAIEYTTATIDSLNLHEGARIVFDIDNAGNQSDVLNMKNLSIRSRDWKYGPEYSSPVIEFNSTSTLTEGTYLIGTLNSIAGSLDDIVIEGNSFASGTHQKLIKKDGSLYLSVYGADNDYIGASDNTSAFWTKFSPSYTIKSGYTYNINFTNYGNSAQNYYNWNLVLANGSGHSTSDRSDYAEYFLLRSDQYGWGTCYQTPALSCTTTTFSWDTFKTDMAAGADVDMDVTFVNSLVSVNATITSATGNVYTYTFTSTEITADELTAFFTVDNSHMTYPVVTCKPYSSVKMTHVNYDDADTSYGELTVAEAGYNVISNGSVSFANTSWGVDYITYVQVDLSSYKKSNVSSVTFSFKGSGSTDSKRSAYWGIGYNSSTWSSTMTYNTANKYITTYGSQQGSSNKLSTVFNKMSWDITDMYNKDADGVLTILIYNTSASGAYVKEPQVSVEYALKDDDEDEEEPTNVIAGTKNYVFLQDFEDATTIDDSWTTSTSGRYTSAQTTLADETHYCRYNAGATNGATLTYSALSSLGTDYTSLDGYTLEFDFAVIPANASSSSGGQTPVFTVYDVNNNSLCHWQVTTAAKASAANTTGTFYLGSTETGTFMANTTPYFYHVKIVGSTDGTVMNVTDADGGSEVYTLSTGLIYIGKWTYYTAKVYGGICLDDISVYTYSPSSLTLSPTSDDEYDTGIYDVVTLDRSFKAGYSTLCVPFNTTVSELTGGDTGAYAAYLSTVESGDFTTLDFENTTEIKANVPYILYLSQALTSPVFADKAVWSESARTVTSDGWSMIGNYDVNKSMYGLYGVANNASIKRGGASSYINGFTAYLTGSSSGARIRFSNGDETNVESLDAQPAVSEIYAPDGVRVSRLRKGVNIVRMNDNTVRKIFVK